MDLFSCFHKGNVDKYERTIEDPPESLRAPLLPHNRLSSSLSLDVMTNEEIPLELSESVHHQLESDRRLKRIYQFLCSEKAYADELHHTLHDHVESMRKSALLTEDEIRFLFSDLEPLLYASYNLCKQLKCALDTWDSKSTQVGYLLNAGLWNLFEDYSIHYVDKCKLLLMKRMTNFEFDEFCHLKEASGSHSLNFLLDLPMNRMTSYADELTEMASTLDNNHPDMADMTRATKEANRMVKLRKTVDNENCMSQFQEHDLYLTNRDAGGGRWKSSGYKHLGGKKQSSYQSRSSVLSSGSSSDVNLQISDRTYLLKCPVKLTAGLQTQQRCLFLFNDLLIIAKYRTGSNYRLKERIPICNLWIASCSERSCDTSLTVGWPTTNVVFTFESVHLRETWHDKLMELIMTAKAKEIPQSVQLKIVKRDCDYTAIKSLLVSNDETASRVVERCLDEFHIVDASAADFQLCVLSPEDDTTFSLSGHEYPFAIWRSYVYASGSRSFDNVSAVDSRVQFHLRSIKKIPKAIVYESSKPKKSKALKRLFARPVSKHGHVKLFGRDLSEVFEQDLDVSHPVMQMLRKLYVDGPDCDGVFRKSANHGKLQAVKQALENGQMINFDEIPVSMTAVILKDFLRNLPNCLLNGQFYQKWMEVVIIEDKEERITAIKRLVQMLPICNQQLLRHLVCVLHHLAQHSDQCKMDSYNLAVCVAQSMLFSNITQKEDVANANLIRKEDAANANLLVQHMIDYTEAIFGHECLLLFSKDSIRPLLSTLRDVSADSDSMQSTGPAEDSVCNSLDYEYNRSNSEADSSPVVPCRAAGLAIQSSQSCDSGLQLGDEIHESSNAFASKLHPPPPPRMKFQTSSESREEEEESKKQVLKKMRRPKKRLAPGIPVAQEWSQMPLESPSDEPVTYPYLLSSKRIPEVGSSMEQLIESPSIQSSESAFVSSIESPSVPSAEYFLSLQSNQSTEYVHGRAFDQAAKKKFWRNVSDDSVLGSLDENSEGSSDAEFSREFQSGRVQQALSNLEKGQRQQTQMNSGFVQQKFDRGRLDLDFTKRRHPPLSQLHGTTFAEECIMTPEELQAGSKTWMGSGDNARGQTSNVNKSSEFERCYIHEHCQNVESDPNSRDWTCFVCSAQSSGTKEDLSRRQQGSLPRRPFQRTDAVESDPEKLKQGMTAAGSDLFPSQVKSFWHHSADGEHNQAASKIGSSVASALSASEGEMAKPSTAVLRANWEKIAGEAGQQKVKRQMHVGNAGKQNLNKNRGKFCQLKENIHFASLEDITADKSKRRMNTSNLEQNRSPSDSCLTPNKSETRSFRSEVMKLESACAKEGNVSHKYVPYQKERLPQKFGQQSHFQNGKEYDTPHCSNCMCMKCASSQLAIELGSPEYWSSNSEDCPKPEPLSRSQAIRKRVKSRRVRKRNSDPRMNVEEHRESELGRSKSDSGELCWNNVRQRYQANLARNVENAHSMENCLSEDPQIKVKFFSGETPKSLGNKTKFVDESVVQYRSNGTKKGNDNGNRKSLTVRDKTWHKQLSEQYTEPVSIVTVISPSNLTPSSRLVNRFGREIEEAVTANSGDGRALPCININISVSVTNNSDRSGRDFSDNVASQTLSKIESGDDDLTEKSRIKKDFLTSASADSSYKFQWSKGAGAVVSPGTEFHSRKAQVASDNRTQGCNFLIVPAVLGSSKYSNTSSKGGCVGSGGRSTRPSCEAVGDVIDDAVLLHPENISWSVAKLKQLYSSPSESCSTKCQPLHHSRSEDFSKNAKEPGQPKTQSNKKSSYKDL